MTDPRIVLCSFIYTFACSLAHSFIHSLSHSFILFIGKSEHKTKENKLKEHLAIYPIDEADFCTQLLDLFATFVDHPRSIFGDLYWCANLVGINAKVLIIWFENAYSRATKL